MSVPRPLAYVLAAAVCVIASLAMGGCKSVNNDVTPSVPVNLNLGSPDLWNTYGVEGFGNYRVFIKSLRVPADFPYSANSATGYGGVLLINGVNPFTSEAGVPMAYNLSCPVENSPDIRVSMQADGLVPVAVCPDCGSHYDVVERGGSPASGPALAEKRGLRRFECRPGPYGGYLIVNF